MRRQRTRKMRTIQRTFHPSAGILKDKVIYSEAFGGSMPYKAYFHSKYHADDIDSGERAFTCIPKGTKLYRNPKTKTWVTRDGDDVDLIQWGGKLKKYLKPTKGTYLDLLLKEKKEMEKHV